MDKDGLSWLRIGATSLTLSLHAAALLWATLAGGPRSLAMPDAEQVVMQVTFVGRRTDRIAAPPPAPEQPRASPRSTADVPTPVAPETPPQDVVEMGEELVAVEVHQLPDVEVPDVESEERPQLASTVSAELAETVEGDPDLPPTERLEYRTAHAPIYPVEARKNRLGGWVWLRVLVDEQGLPLEFLRDPRTTAADILVDSAIVAIREWRFNPAMKSGAPVRAWIAVPIGFFVRGPAAGARASLDSKSAQGH